MVACVDGKPSAGLLFPDVSFIEFLAVEYKIAFALQLVKLTLYLWRSGAFRFLRLEPIPTTAGTRAVLPGEQS